MSFVFISDFIIPVHPGYLLWTTCTYRNKALIPCKDTRL